MAELFRATLERASWLRRVLRVCWPEGEQQIAYSGRSLMEERITLDGKLEVKYRIGSWFRPVSRFFMASWPAAIVLRVWPWLAIRSFHLLIDGKVLYCDHRRELFEDAGPISAIRDGRDAPIAAPDDSKDPLCPHCDRPLLGLRFDFTSVPADLIRPTGPIGRPTAYFTFPRRQRLALIVAGILAAIVGIGLLAMLWFIPNEGFVILGLLLLARGPALVLYVWKYRRLQAIAGSAGIALIENDVVSSCRWQEIDAVQESLVTGEAKAVLAASARDENHVFRVTCRDGKVLVFRSFLDDLPWLGQIIQHETLPYLLPPAVAALEAGDALDFGPLCIDAEGLRSAPEKRLAWGELEDAEIANGLLVVKQVGKWRAWFKMPIGQVPNAHVLLALVHHYRNVDQAVDLLPSED
jgi:hypothetical protein